MNPFVLGASVTRRSIRREIETERSENPVEPAPKPAPRKKKIEKSFAKVAKAGNFEKSEIRGSNDGVQLGIKPVKIGLHVKVLAGGDSKKVANLLKQKRLKATNVKILDLSSGPKYSTHQIQLDVPISKTNFWSDENFWPTGVYVRRWKGRLARDLHDFYHRRLELSGIGQEITKDRVEQHLKTKIYNGVDFISLVSSDVVRGKCVVDLKVRFDIKDKLVIKNSTFPDGVKGKWLSTKIKASRDWC